jgi:hypothetical protein
LQESNSFPGGKEAESVIKNIGDIFINKTFLIRTCLANSFMIGNFSIIRFLIPEFYTSRIINFHEEPLSVIKLDASFRDAGQDSGYIRFGSDDVLPL